MTQSVAIPPIDALQEQAAAPPSADVIVQVVQAYRPGDLVFLRCSHALKREQLEALLLSARRAEAETGIRIVVLDHTLSVESAPPPPWAETRPECMR